MANLLILNFLERSFFKFVRKYYLMTVPEDIIIDFDVMISKHFYVFFIENISQILHNLYIPKK
jgi:hypothetical protein